MIVELQLDADTFLKSFREQLRKALLCELTEDVLDFNPTDSVPGEPFIIVGYEVGTTTLRRAKTQTTAHIHTGSFKTVTFRPVFKPEVVQELVVHISWVKDLRAANTHKAVTIPLHLPLVFELSMDTGGNPQVLCFNYVGLEALPADDPLAQKLGGKIHGSCIWLPIDRVIGSYMPKDMKLINGHLSMSESRKCIAVRLEFWDEGWGATSGDPARAVPYWDHFYANGVIDRLQQGPERAGWNIFLDHHAIVGFVKEEVLTSIKGQSGITITRQPKAEWFDYAQIGPLTFPGIARVHVDLEVEKKDACYCFTEDLDVSAEITADVYISVPKLDTVRIDINSNVSPNFWDATCCVLTAAAFWPVLGFGQLVKGGIKDWQYLVGFLPFVAFIAAIVKVNDVHFDAKGKWIKDEDDEDHAYSEDHLYLPADPNFGQLSVKGSKPLSDGSSLQAEGLFLWGGMQVFSQAQPALEDPHLEPFCWQKAGRCSKRIAASSQFRLFPDNPLLHVCHARIIDDQYDVYKLEVRKEEHGFYDLILTVDFWSMNPKFWEPGNSYPCRVLLKTTGGVRILTLKPLSALSEEQFKALAKQAAFEYVNNCYLPRHRLFEELEWPIEQIIEQPGLHYVQLRAAGLPPGERVDLIGRTGEELGRFTVNRSGTLLVTALSHEREGLGTALRLRRTAAGSVGAASLPGRMQTLSRNQPQVQTLLHHLDPRHLDTNRELHADIPLEGGHGVGAARSDMLSKVCPPDALGTPKDMIHLYDNKISILAASMEGLEQYEERGRGVMLRETMLEERGSIRLWSDVHAVVGSENRVFAVTDGLVEAYDVFDAHMPMLAKAWPADGVRGAVMFDERLLLWGEPGIWVADDGAPVRRHEPFTRCEGDAARGAVVAGGRLFVLIGGKLCVYDSQLCEVARYDAGGAEEVATVGGLVVLRDHEGLRVFDGLHGPGDGHAHSHCHLSGITKLEAPALPFGGPAIYARRQDSGILLRLSASGPPETLAEFPGGAWFAGVVRAGRTLAYLSDEDRVIRLLEPGRTEATE
jgi:hypothetical protein